MQIIPTKKFNDDVEFYKKDDARVPSDKQIEMLIKAIL